MAERSERFPEGVGACLDGEGLRALKGEWLVEPAHRVDAVASVQAEETPLQ
jgi:hypothetical protein